MTNYLRPDEKAAESEIKRAQKRTGEARSGIQTALSLGSSALGASIASKIVPFINQYIPEDLALKGISKVAPSVGNFLKNGMKQGLSLSSGLDFLKKEMSNSTEKEPPKESRNIIQQYSPELHQFIDQEVKKGRNVLEAGAIAQSDKRFGGVINKITKDHKTPWSSILESVYGSNQQAPIQQQQQQPQGLDPKLAQIIQGIKSSMNNLGVG